MKISKSYLFLLLLVPFKVASIGKVYKPPLIYDTSVIRLNKAHEEYKDFVSNIDQLLDDMKFKTLSGQVCFWRLKRLSEYLEKAIAFDRPDIIEKILNKSVELGLNVDLVNNNNYAWVTPLNRAISYNSKNVL